MDKKAIIHLWMGMPSYFQVPIQSRLEQLKAMEKEKREQTALMYLVVKLLPRMEGR
jgi:hypothetical protein